jgi:BirA family biotin operon repressor/biotin-[acetyl-CoA-carboxylase] ligase
MMLSASLGAPRLHLRVTESTNRRARELAGGGAPHGTLVTTEHQTAGRGRQGRTWTAPPGRALLCSLVLRPPRDLLPLAVGAAVAEVAGDRAMVKWPNDVLLDGRKVAGILIESRPQDGWAVVGIGLNVAIEPDQFPTELRDSAGSLGHDPGDVEPVLGRLLLALERWLAASPGAVLSRVRERDALRGQPVSWAGGEGVARGIGDDGRLLVLTDAGGELMLAAGEVHLIIRGSTNTSSI